MSQFGDPWWTDYPGCEPLSQRQIDERLADIKRPEQSSERESVKDMEKNLAEIQAALEAPFDPSEVKWKPQTVKGDRALAVAFIDARVVQERLDDVLGLGAWQDDYEFLPNNSVVCRLRVRLGDEWITKTDVGSPSEQPDEGDRTKAAVSDALKRAAVKYGVGRYLYRLPLQWVPFDAQKKRIVNTPQLPAWAIPKSNGQPEKPAEPAQPNIDSVATRRWLDWLANKPPIDSLNENLPALKDMPESDRKPTWALVKAYAHTHGWEFNTEAKKFTETKSHATN